MFCEHPPLNGLSVLVLEDEMMVAMLLEDMLQELGCHVVGPVSTVEAALAKLDTERVDVALLDVNLSHGHSGYPVASALALLSRPFTFVTGYGAGTLAPAFRGFPTLQKPFQFASLLTALTAMVGEPHSA
jgi:CheY-like chemotaxis protein